MSESGKPNLCPYCGHQQPTGDRCQQCGGLFEPLSRRATQIAMGPWFIRDAQKPFRPGCSFEVVRKQVDAGRVKADTVIRGPTTQQFWTHARHTPGIAHLLGHCHDCGARVSSSAEKCPECAAVFALPETRNELGLQYPTAAQAAEAQAEINRIVAEQQAGDEEAGQEKADGATGKVGGTDAGKDTSRGDRGRDGDDDKKHSSKSGAGGARRVPRRVVLPAHDLLDQIVGPARQRLSPMAPGAPGSGSNRESGGEGAGKRESNVPVVVVRPIGGRAGAGSSGGAAGKRGRTSGRGSGDSGGDSGGIEALGEAQMLDAAGRALDFAPTDGDAFPVPPAPPKAKRSALAKALGLMVLLVLAFYCFWLTWELTHQGDSPPPPESPAGRTQSNFPQGKPATSDRPSTPAGANKPAGPSKPAEIPKPLVRPTPPASLPADFPLTPANRPSDAGPAEAPAGGATGARSSSSRTGDSRTPDARPADARTPAARAADPRAAEQPVNLFAAPPTAATIRTRLSQADRLEASGKFADALAIVEDLARNVAPDARPPEMVAALTRLRDRVQKENARKTFED
ncbi:MAG: hypothetical protein NTW19_10595 [Planctomycetota bacterium]|nr:hypothetical protein [Planctomycetota bacterium]